jgi:hypothetical protein
MQRHRDIAEIVLQETERTSMQYIWEKEIKPRLPYVRNTAEQTPSMPENDANSVVETPVSVSPVAEVDKNSAPADGVALADAVSGPGRATARAPVPAVRRPSHAAG